LFSGGRPAAQDADLAIVHGDDGRFNSVFRWRPVDDERDSSAKVIHDMLRGRWTDMTESIRAWRSQRLIQFTHNLGEDRMRADSHRDCIETCCHNFRNDLVFRQNHRKRAGPKLVGQL